MTKQDSVSPLVPTGERIAKRIARAGLCSRRDAERWIDAGRVSIDGVTITTPAIVVEPHQNIQVDGKPLPDKARPQLWGYFKPTGVITTNKDPQGRPTVFEQLPESMPRVVSIGRLDLNSEGLILLTTDSQMARHAELPKTAWPRCYRVRVYGDINADDLDALKNGIEIDGMRYDRIDVDVTRETGRNSWLFITIFEGKNREIRRVLQHLGLHVNRLIRVAYGPFALDERHPGDLWEIPYADFAKHFPHLQGNESKKPVLTHQSQPGSLKKIVKKEAPKLESRQKITEREIGTERGKKPHWAMDKKGPDKNRFNDKASKHAPHRRKV